MQVFFGLNNLPDFINPAVTIGTFDGVHLGHKVILNKLIATANKNNGESVIITFEPHPQHVISSDKHPILLLNTLEEKIENLKKTGIDNLVIVNFTDEFASITASDYIENFLIKYFHPHTLIIGFDHHFGFERKGDFRLLEKMKSVFKYELQEIPLQLIEKSKISSTHIREALQEGNITKANNLLASFYTITGIVITGKKRGTQLGFPTANIKVENANKLIPANGVYAVKIKVHDLIYDGMLNIGINPTVTNEGIRQIEANIFDFDKMIYGEKIKLYFIKRLRDEKKFDNISEMITVIEVDKINALQVLKNEEFPVND